MGIRAAVHDAMLTLTRVPALLVLLASCSGDPPRRGDGPAPRTERGTIIDQLVGSDRTLEARAPSEAAPPPPSNVIPADRRVDWSQVGVKGDIPSRTTICTTLSPGSGDRAASIQSAIDSCPAGQVVKLEAGTFSIGKGVVVKSGVTLRGAGKGATIIKNTVAVTYLAAFMNSPDSSFTKSTARSITGGNTRGSTSITTSAAHGWAVGDILLIDQLEDPTGDPPMTAKGVQGACTWCSRSNGTRPVGQVARIAAVPSPTTATLELPLVKSFDKSPQAIKLTGVTSGAGIEDLTLDSTAACASDNYGILAASFAENSWILRVELKRVCRIGLRMDYGYRNTVRSSTIHETLHHTSNGGYLFWMMGAGSANLLEDNVFYNGLIGFVYNGALSGNVIAYNYFEKMWNTDFPGRGWSGIASHGGHGMMNLFEGNCLNGPVFLNDFIWGSTSHSTYFRNRQRTDTSPQAPVNTLYGVQHFENATYMNMVGNVFGTVGYETVYETSNVYDQKKGIYYLGTAQVQKTILRHGNWDSVHKDVVWDANNSEHNLPPSLYRGAKPVFWGSQPWPPYGPELGAGSLQNKIPAQARYESGAP